MRLSPLFLSVLMFVTVTDFAAAGHPGHGSSGGAAPATQQTDRQLQRQMQRAQRSEQLDALRTRFGQGARTGDSAAGTAQTRLSSLVQILPVGDPGTDVTDLIDDSGLADSDAPQYLGPPIMIDDGNGFWEGFPEDELEIQETDGKSGHGRGGPIIYTLSGAPGPQFRGNHGNGGPGSADAQPFAPLEKLRGNATETPAMNHIPDALPSAQSTSGAAGHFDLSRADRIFAKRLADIDHLRDIALKNGNVKLLDRADKLEEIARSQYTRRGGTIAPELPPADPGTPVPDPIPEPPTTDPVPPVTDPLPEPPMADPVPPTPDPMPVPPVEEPTVPETEDPGTATVP